MKHTKSVFYTIASLMFLSLVSQAYADNGVEEIYRETCSACHGEDGKGAFEGIPDLTDTAGRLSKDDEVLIKNITEGFQSEGSPMAMPEKGGNEDLTDEDIKNLVGYLRDNFGAKK